MQATLEAGATAPADTVAATAQAATQPAFETAEARRSALAATAAAPSRGEVTVRFLRRHRGYNRGVEAGFAPGQAGELVARGVAIQVHPPVQREPLQGRQVRK